MPEVPRTRRALLAEDQALNQRVVLQMLRALGWEADVVSTAASALVALRTRRYDAVLMDLELPDMTGVQATRLLRADRNITEQPRVIAMTASDREGDRQRCIAAGMNAHLPKPVSLASLRAALSGS